MKPPIPALLCGECGSVMKQSCETCEQKVYDEQCETHQLLKDQEERSYEGLRSQLAAIKEVEGLLGVSLGNELTCDLGPDEDGEMLWSFSLRLGGTEFSGTAGMIGAAFALLLGEVADHYEALAKGLRTLLRREARGRRFFSYVTLSTCSWPLRRDRPRCP